MTADLTVATPTVAERNRDLQRKVDGLTRAVIRVQDDNAALRAEVMRGDAQRTRRDVRHIEVG